jgi:peptide deformylase
MAIHSIIYLPDARLRQKTAQVTVFDDALQTLIDDMYETMYAAKGIGLAANQIGIMQQITVIDVSQDKSERLCAINPEIIASEGSELMEEGCLSIPGSYDSVPRALRVTVRALDRHGNPYEIAADGALAHCFQHEIDHLNGKVFIDYLSPLKRKLAQKKIQKLMRETQ